MTANTGASANHAGPTVLIQKEATVFSIGSMNSEGMLSDNPKSGIHETTVARTIDANGSNPAGYQGGDLIVIKKNGVCGVRWGQHEGESGAVPHIIVLNDQGGVS